MRRVIVLWIPLIVVACATPRSVECLDGTFCPADNVCIDDPAALLKCALPDQLVACDGLADPAPCTVRGTPGECHGHVCTSDGCGDSILELGEVCDDGNRVSGDGCRADCRKVETCNDGVIDQGE